MFHDYVYSGKHMMCDIKNIQNIDLLNDKNRIKQLLTSICEKQSFKILGELDHIFTPQGCSIIFLLSESHISVHTFPERNHLSFDIYTCRQYENDNVYIEIFNYIVNEMNSSESVYKIVDRYF
jgi:S-adenosylmethionine decarboxylase